MVGPAYDTDPAVKRAGKPRRRSIGQGMACGLACGWPVFFATIPKLPPILVLICGFAAILVLCSFIFLAVKAWEQLGPDKDQLAKKAWKKAYKVKGSSVKEVRHRVVVQNSAVLVFRQAGLGPLMPLVETHPFRYPNGEEGEKIDLTRFIDHLLKDGRVVVHESPDGKILVTLREMSDEVSAVVLERTPEAAWAWRAHAEVLRSEDLLVDAEMSAVGNKYASEWLF